MVGAGSVEPRRKRRRGFLFWGLITLFVITAAIFGAAWWVWNSFVGDLEEFASDAPLTIEAPAFSPEEVAASKQKAEEIDQLLASAGPPETVVWEPKELQALLEAQVGKKELPGPLRLGAEGDDLLVTLSWPLDDLPVDRLHGKWFSGTFRVGLEISHGHVDVDIREGRAPDGRELSGSLRAAASQAAEHLIHEKLAKELDRLESVEVRDGKVHVRVRERSEPEETEASEPANG